MHADAFTRSSAESQDFQKTESRAGNGRKIQRNCIIRQAPCSLSPHIALLEAGLPYSLVEVDLRAKKLENGDDYLAVNPMGQALALDSGEIVTEGPVIIQEALTRPSIP